MTKDSLQGFGIMRCLVACCLGLSLSIAVSGCKSCDCVESELRARENDVRVLREELDRCGVYNQTLQQEVHTLRGQLGVPLQGQSPAAYPVQVLTLGRQTGGRSNDVAPGDDSLQVQVEPRDLDNQVIKAPGQLLVLAQEITSAGIKRPLSSWMIPPEQVRKSWVNGLLTTGYLFTLPWKNWPTTEKLRITAQFQLADGRVFEADRDVIVRLIPVNQRPAAVVPNPNSNPEPAPPPAGDKGPVPNPNLNPAPASLPTGDKGPTLLPAPKRVDPAAPDKPPPSEAIPGPFLGVSRTKQEPPAAEILRPLPIK